MADLIKLDIMGVEFGITSAVSPGVLCTSYLVNMVLDATKPVFGVSYKVRFKPACSAT